VSPRERMEQRLHPPPEPGGSPGYGILLTAALHVLALVIVAIIGAVLDEGFLFLMFGGFLGVTQIVYMVPAIAIASTKRKPDIVKGMLIAMSGTFLFNALCAGVMAI